MDKFNEKLKALRRIVGIVAGSIWREIGFFVDALVVCSLCKWKLAFGVDISK